MQHKINSFKIKIHAIKSGKIVVFSIYVTFLLKLYRQYILKLM